MSLRGTKQSLRKVVGMISMFACPQRLPRYRPQRHGVESHNSLRVLVTAGNLGTLVTTLILVTRVPSLTEREGI